MTIQLKESYGKDFYIKWVASIMQIIGYALTGLGIVPLNSYFFIFGLIGWFAVGVLWNDRALILIHIVAGAALISGLLTR